jgi:hypothetical protein
MIFCFVFLDPVFSQTSICYQSERFFAPEPGAGYHFGLGLKKKTKKSGKIGSRTQTTPGKHY